MTNREAIKILQNIIRCNETECVCDCMVCEFDDGTTAAKEAEAIKLAIAALEKQQEGVE